MNAPTRLLGFALLAILLVATIGNGGSDPLVLLVWHGMLLAAVLVAWWFTAGSRVGRRPAAGVSLALSGFAFLVAAGLLRAPYTYAAWLTVVELIAFLAVFALAVRCSGWLAGPLGFTLVAGGWVQMILLLVQRYIRQEPRPAGSFLNPNDLAAWFVAAILFAAGRALANPRDRTARNLGWCVLPLLAGMVVIGSRGAWIGLAAGAVWLGVGFWASLGRRGRQLLAAAGLVLVVSGSAAIVVRMQQPDPFRYQRLSIWRASMTVVLEAPWSGSGPGQFSRASRNLQFPDGQGPLRYDRSFSTTHSDWLRSAVELGWPGLLALVWIVAATAAHAARRRRIGAPCDSGALAALSGLFVHAAFDNLTRAPGIYLVTALLLGLVVAIEAPARRAIGLGWRFAVAGFLVLGFAFGDYAPWRSYSAASAGDFDAAVDWNPVDSGAAIRRAESICAQGPLDWERYREARQAAERAVRLSPRDGDLLRRAARIEAEGVRTLFPDRANRERVAGIYRDAHELQRANPFVPLELAAFLLDLGDPHGARRAAELALEIEPQSVAPRLLLAHAFASSGAIEQAEKRLSEAREIAAEQSERAGAGAYARDLLTLDADALERVIRALADARQAASQGARFQLGDAEESIGSGRHN